jgi:hypothetical protein
MIDRSFAVLLNMHYMSVWIEGGYQMSFVGSKKERKKETSLLLLGLDRTGRKQS